MGFVFTPSLATTTKRSCGVITRKWHSGSAIHPGVGRSMREEVVENKGLRFGCRVGGRSIRVRVRVRVRVRPCA